LKEIQDNMSDFKKAEEAVQAKDIASFEAALSSLTFPPEPYSILPLDVSDLVVTVMEERDPAFLDPLLKKGLLSTHRSSSPMYNNVPILFSFIGLKDQTLPRFWIDNGADVNCAYEYMDSDYDEGEKMIRETLLAASIRSRHSKNDDFETARMLLKHGVTPGDTDDIALNKALTAENVPLFNTLLEVGVVLTDSVKEYIRSKLPKLAAALEEFESGKK